MFEPDTFVDPQLTIPDHIVLQNLLRDIHHRNAHGRSILAHEHGQKTVGKFHLAGIAEPTDTTLLTDIPFDEEDDEATIALLQALNNPRHSAFDPTVFLLWDLKDIKKSVKWMLQPYIRWAQQAARHPTDIVMLTHLILYFSTSVPSAVCLFMNFSWLHGLAHWIMQAYYVGSYTLMKHQHIHMNGVLSEGYHWIDVLFPYIMDPLMGHTWNSYYYHHVKHHHVEGNGPDDLSSTVRYQRDDLFHFLQYVGRFFFFVWLDLPLYFLRKRKTTTALKVAFWEIASFIDISLMASWRFRPTLFVFILPVFLLRLGLMVGNWGQHAFVDELEPDSDFRSSITLIDVAVSISYLLSRVDSLLTHRPEQPVLLQRRLSHVASSEFSKALA